VREPRRHTALEFFYFLDAVDLLESLVEADSFVFFDLVSFDFTSFESFASFDSFASDAPELSEAADESDFSERPASLDGLRA